MAKLELNHLDILADQVSSILQHHDTQVKNLRIKKVLHHSPDSVVLSTNIHGRHYIVKLFLAPNNYRREMHNFRQLDRAIPILLAIDRRNNPLGVDVIVFDMPLGASFSSLHLTPTILERLSDRLLSLHRVRRTRRIRLKELHQAIDDTLSGAGRAVDPHLINAVADGMHRFLAEHASLMRVSVSLLHNDLWWDNIIIAGDEVYLIDWEWMRRGDYLEDIAYLRVMLDFQPAHDRARTFWETRVSCVQVEEFFLQLVGRSSKELDDPTALIRYNFYLQLHLLRRISDYATGMYGDIPELLESWTQHLSRFRPSYSAAPLDLRE